MYRIFLLAVLSSILLSSCSIFKAKSTAELKNRNLVTLTYNIHHGAPENSKVVNLNDIAEVIRKSGASLIALQEVDINVPRSGNVDQAKELGRLLNMHYYFSKSIDLQGGEYGVAILSKYPLSNMRNELLPSPIRSEQRSVALATVNLPGNVSIEFASTHLDLNSSNRLAQVEYLNSLSKSLNKPILLAGDFNAIPTSDEMMNLQREFKLSCIDTCPLSFPVRNPDRAIDFVTFNNKAAQIFELVSAVALTGEFASDHLPVVVEFKYK